MKGQKPGKQTCGMCAYYSKMTGGQGQCDAISADNHRPHNQPGCDAWERINKKSKKPGGY